MKKILSFFCIFILLLSTMVSASASTIILQSKSLEQQNSLDLGHSKIVLKTSDSSSDEPSLELAKPKLQVYSKTLELRRPEISKDLVLGAQAEPVKRFTFTQKDISSPILVNQDFTITLTAEDPQYDINAMTIGRAPYKSEDYELYECTNGTICTSSWTFSEDEVGTYYYRIKARNSEGKILSDVLTVTVAQAAQTNYFNLRTYAIDGAVFNSNGNVQEINNVTIEVTNEYRDQIEIQEGVTYADFRLRSNMYFLLNYTTPDYEQDEDWMFLDSRLPSCTGNACSFENGNYKTDCNYNYVRNAYVCELTHADSPIPVNFEFTPFGDSTGKDNVVRYINKLYKNNAPKIAPFPRISFYEGEVFDDLFLDKFVLDTDDDLSELSWTYSGNTNVDVSINADTRQVTLTPKDPDFNGEEIVRFTVSDVNGNSDSELLYVTIMDAANEPPLVTAKNPAADNVDVLETENQMFYIITEDSDDIILEYRWYLNDQPVIGAPGHALDYTAPNGPATDILKVEIVDDSGSKTETSWTINVVDTHPEIDFDWGPSYVVANATETTTSFNAIVNSPDYPDNTRYEWDFGDGTISTDEDPTHLFEEVGDKTVTLKVWDSDDAEPSTISKHILVQANNVAPDVTDLVITPESGIQGTPITINVNVVDDISVGSVTARIFTPDLFYEDYDMTNPAGDDLFTYEFTGHQIGVHNVQIIANDTYGNSDDQTTGNFEITKDPSVGDTETTITAPENNFEVNLSSSFELNATVKALNANVQDCQFVLNFDDTVFSLAEGNNPETIGNLAADEEFQASWTLETSTEKKDGIHTVTVTTECLSGGQSTDTVDIKILQDVVKPEVGEIVMANGYLIQPGEIQGFMVQVLDNVAVDVNEVKFEVSWTNGVENFTEVVDSTQFFLDPSFYVSNPFENTNDEAYYTVKVLAKDTSGNLNDTITGQFIVASQTSFGNSTTEIILPQENATVDEQAPMTVSVRTGAIEGDIYDCDVVLTFEDQDPANDVFNVTTLQKDLPDLMQDETITTDFVVTPQYFGDATITADTVCNFGEDSQAVVNFVVDEVLDRQGPNITINSPLHGATYNVENILVSLNVEDATGVDTILYGVNGDPDTEYTGPVQVTFVDGQINTLQVWANDTLGNENTGGAIFNLDTTGPYIPPDTTPEVTLEADPTEGELSLNVTFTCSVEEGNKPFTYTMEYDDGSVADEQGPTDETSVTFTHNFRGGPLHQEQFHPRCFVLDGDLTNPDQDSAEAEINLTADAEIPVIDNVDAPAEVEIGNMFTISATVTDNDQVNEVTITLDVEEGNVTNVGNVYSAEFNSTALGLGPKTFTITATDMDENIAVPISGLVEIVDTGRPTITVHSPINGHEYTDLNISLNVTFEDADGLAVKEYSIDADPFQPYTDIVDLSTVLELNNEYTIHLFAQDTTGNVARKDVSFSVFDREDPEILNVDMVSESKGTSQLFEVVNGDAMIINVKAKDDLGIVAGNITIDEEEVKMIPLTAPTTLYDHEEVNHIFNSIVTTGTLSTIDGATKEEQVNLGFDFNYAGVDFNSITINEDGYAYFNVLGGIPPEDNDVLPLHFMDMLAPYWDNLDLTQGHIYYEEQFDPITGDSIFVIEWNNVGHADITGGVTFQVLLYENTNEILFVYDDVLFGDLDYDNGRSATVGLSTAFFGERVSFNQNSLEKGKALLFTPTEVSDTYNIWVMGVTTDDFEPGLIPYTVEIVDSNDNVETSSGNFRVFGNEDPVIEEIEATPNAVVQGENIQFTAMLVDDHEIDDVLSTYEVRDVATSTLVDSGTIEDIDSGVAFSIPPGGPSEDRMTVIHTVDTADYVAIAGLGDYTFTIDLVDVDGNTAQASEAFFIRDIPDTTKPNITLNDPQPGDNVAIGTLVRLSAEVTDDDLDPDTVKITVAGQTLPTTNLAGDTYFYDYTTDTTGTISYTFNAQDRSGNAANPKTDTIDVFGLGNPVVDPISTNPGAVVLGDNINLLATITDDHGIDLDTSSFQVHEVATGLLEAEIFLSDVEVTLNGDDYSYAFDTTTLPNLGEYTFTAIANDIDGLSGQNTVSFHVLPAPDNENPVITLNAHSPDPVHFGDVVTVSAEVTDNGGVLTSVTVTIDGVEYDAVPVGGNTYEYDWNANKEGTILYTFNAEDPSGNTATPRSDNFDVLPVPTIINSNIYGGFYAFNLASDVTETTVTNSWIIESTVEGTPVSTIEDSNLTYAILTDVAPIRNCVVIGTAGNPSTINGGSCVDVFIDPSTIVNSTTTGASIRNSNIENSDVSGSDITDSDITNNTICTDSTLDDTTMETTVCSNSTVTNSNVENSTFDGVTITNAVIRDNTIYSGTISDGTTTYDADANGPAKFTDIFNFAPIAAFTADVTTGRRPLAVNFDATTTTDPNIPGLLGDVLTYDWDFGDGTTGTGATVAHTFTTAGNRNVVLTVNDNFGKSDTETLRITVTNPPGNPVYRGGGGGGGGGGGHAQVKDKSLTDIPPEGKLIELTINDRLNYEKDFKRYSLLVTSVAMSGFVKMRSFPPPGIDYQWQLMETKNIDMDKDGKNDFSFQLREVQLRKAIFFVKDLSKPDVEPTSQEPTAFDRLVDDLGIGSGEVEVEETLFGNVKEGVLDIAGNVIPDERASPRVGGIISLAIIFGGLAVFVVFRKIF